MAQDNDFEDFEQTVRRLQQVAGLPFSELLTPERVARALGALGLKFRERIYTPVATLWVFLSQVLSADHSCREAVARLLAWRVSQGRPRCSAETASYCDARQRLPVELVKQLVRETGRELEQEAEQAWLWKDRHVKLADGTTMTMPDTPENQAAFPRRRNQVNGVGFPIARVVAIVSLSCAALLDAAMGPMRGKKTGENTLFRGLQAVLEPGDVLLADRLFGSFQDVATLRAQRVDVVVRQHATRRTDFRRGRWLGTLDHIVVWKRPKFSNKRFDRATWESLPEEMEVRELRFRVTQAGFRPADITLATTLLDAVEYPAEEICDLYRERWHCELDLRSLKTSMQMHHLRCKSPKMVETEVWTHFLAYNLIRQTTARAARQRQVLPRQLSFKGAVQTVNSFAPYLALRGSDRDRLWGDMLVAIATHIVGNRPDRYEPRKIKSRSAKFPYMTHTRSVERQRLCA